MRKQYSVAQARDQLPGILHEVERGIPVEITRRGKPVAVVIPLSEYQRLTGERPSFWEAYERWRQTVDWDAVDDDIDPWADVRDRSPGRDIEL